MGEKRDSLRNPANGRFLATFLEQETTESSGYYFTHSLRAGIGLKLDSDVIILVFRFGAGCVSSGG